MTTIDTPSSAFKDCSYWQISTCETTSSADVGSSAISIVSSWAGGARPMSENTVNTALRRLGYDKDSATAHGLAK